MTAGAPQGAGRGALISTGGCGALVARERPCHPPWRSRSPQPGALDCSEAWA